MTEQEEYEAYQAQFDDPAKEAYQKYLASQQPNALASARANQQVQQASHSYMVQKPDAEYESFLSIATPFGRTPKVVPNPGGMFTQAGKIMRETESGVRQLFGDEEYARETQNMADTFNQKRHNAFGRIAGELSLIAPHLMGGPGAVRLAGQGLSKVGAKGAGNELKTLANMMTANESRSLAPGLGGALYGGTAGAYHVDPDLSKEDQMKTRLNRLAIGVVTGGVLDVGGAMASNRALNRSGRLEREAQSEGLPVTVNTPAARLWDQQGFNVRRLGRMSRNDADNFGKVGVERADHAVNQPLLDIAENARRIREDVTGSSASINKGEAIGSTVDALRASEQAAAKNVQKLDNKVADTAHNIFVTRDKYGDKLKKRLNKHNERTKLDEFISGKFGADYATTMGRIRGPGSPSGMPADNLGSMIAARKVLENLRSTSGSGALNQVTKNTAKELDSTIDKIVKSGDMVSTTPKAIDTIVSANKAKDKYTTQFQNNPIIAGATRKKEPFTNAEFVDTLFGADNRYAGRGTQAKTVKLMNKLSTLGDVRRPLQKELLERLFTGNKGKYGKDGIDIETFINTYGNFSGGGNREVLKAILPEKTVNQLDTLLDVSVRNKAGGGEPRWSSEPGMIKEMLTGITPGLPKWSSVPGLRGLGPKALDDMLFAGRQQTGKRGPLAESRGAGTAARTVATQYDEEANALTKFIKDRIGKTIGILKQ